MTQTPRGLVVELAIIYILTIQDVFMAVQSKGASLRRVVSEILHHKKFGQVRSLVLFSEYSPTGLVLIEDVPIDPEVMAAIGELVYSVRERSTARA